MIGGADAKMGGDDFLWHMSDGATGAIQRACAIHERGRIRCNPGGEGGAHVLVELTIGQARWSATLTPRLPVGCRGVMGIFDVRLSRY